MGQANGQEGPGDVTLPVGGAGLAQVCCGQGSGRRHPSCALKQAGCLAHKPWRMHEQACAPAVPLPCAAESVCPCPSMPSCGGQSTTPARVAPALQALADITTFIRQNVQPPGAGGAGGAPAPEGEESSEDGNDDEEEEEEESTASWTTDEGLPPR